MKHSPRSHRHYKAILTKKFSYLRSVSRASLQNVAMELRKCANHPYLCMENLPALIPGPEQVERSEPTPRTFVNLLPR